MPFTTRERTFTLGTPLGEDELLIQTFEGSEQLSRPFHFKLTLLSERDDITPDKLIGKRVTLRIETADAERHWTGLVSSFTRLGTRQAPGATDETLTTYHCEVVPWLWLMTLHEDCRIFQNQSVPDIVEAIFAEFRFSDYELQLTGTHEPLVYCTQYRESNFNFIARLLERAGIYYYFRHEEKTETLVLTDNNDRNPPLDPAQVRFGLHGSFQEGDTISSLNRQERIRSGRFVTHDYNFEKPAADLIGSADSLVRIGDNGDFERFVTPAGHTQHNEGEAIARLLMEAEEAEHETLSGESDVRLLTAGYMFDVEEHPDEDFNRRYLVVKVEHHGSNNLDGDGGSSYRNDFSAIPNDVPYRSPLLTPRTRMPGPQTAVVTGPPKEEIYTDQYGRIKLHFHWDRHSKNDDKSSCFVRVAQGWAGRGWGAFFLPRVGMEVVVDFIEGDPDRPLVTGCVYNGDNHTPYGLPAHATISTLKSNSSKGPHGFNEFRFEDKKGHEQLMMHAQNRMDVCVNDVFCERNGGERDLRVGKDFDLSIGKDLNFITKERWYQSIGSDMDLAVGGDVRQDFKGSLTQRVAQLIDINAKNYSLVVESGINIKSDTLVMEVASDLKVRGGSIVLEASDGGITLKCGGSFITIKPDGIDIEGPMVKINCGGSAQGAEPAKPAGALVMQDPVEPNACSCGTPGESGHGGGAAHHGHTSHTVDPANPPTWTPPKPPKLPVIPPVPVVPPVPEKNCSIKTLDLSCAHGARHPDPASRILQVVPNTGALETSVSYKVDSIKVTFSGKKKSGGKDTIKLNGTAVDGSTGPIHTAILRSPSAPTAADFSGGASQSFDVPAPICDSWWPYPFKPDIYYVYGKGCDDNQLSWTVEAYPSIEYSGTIDVLMFEDLIKKLFGNDNLSTQQKYGLKASISFKGPSGSFSLVWGWSENSDWRAYFFVQAKAGITFVSADGVGTANLRDLLLAAGLTFAGIPFNASMEVFDFLDDLKIGKDSILDILAALTLSLGLKLSIGLDCDIKKKFFPSGGEEIAPSAKLKGTATIHADLIYRVGPPDVVNVVLSGKGEAPFEISGDFSIKADGLHMAPAIDFKGLTIKIDIEFNLMRLKVKKGLLNWQVLDPYRIWPDPSDPSPPDWRLLPP
ncbi:type VI secretion system Vgr family protein [Dyella tabacisoli]|uniref:Type VI secretion system tip protein VgrG n=1 Tax=Dyella tabacisoli TaxID=2282381 RepID=A0A369UJ95_9GAMM|nr:type VI secretion system tip protein TssI/VgrG [Dyella tabacisoli]RDD80195.1 type VI secretion system tip protein VgrG [Dyella tabacisoli]